MSKIFVTIFKQAMQRPVLSLLNLVGLAGGIATCMLIFLYAWSELNYDSWVPEQDGLYRVEGHFVQSATGFAPSTQVPLAEALMVEGSAFSRAIRQSQSEWPVQRDDFINYESVDVVDPGFLDMFPLNFIAGSRESTFSTLNNVLISQSMATKYFGETDAIGQTLTLNGNLEYTVSGIFTDLPARSDVNVHILVPLQNSLLRSPESWDNISLRTFVRLKPGASVADAEAQLAQLVEKHRPFTGESPGEMSEFYRLFLQPFGDIHLGSRGRTGADSIGNYGLVYGFVGIAILILAISAFNYVSLSTARALEREKEICLRKVMGAKRSQIVKLIMTESIGQTTIAALLGLMIIVDALPFFSEAMGQQFTLSELYQPIPVALFIIGTLIVGILSGLYPAFFVSAFRPVKFLSGGRSRRAGLNRLRTGLVFVQFTVCIGLIIGAVTISKQISHINGINLGFDQNNLIIVRGINRAETASRAEALKQFVATIPGVEAVTRSQIVPLESRTSIEGFYNRNILRDESIPLRLIPVDYDFFPAYGATIIAGRQLSDQYAGDIVELDGYGHWSEEDGVGNVVLNRESVKDFGYTSPEAAVGEQILLWQEGGGTHPLSIVGVVEDVRFNSTRGDTQALVFYHNPDRMDSMTIRTSEDNTNGVIQALGGIWADMYPNTPLRLEFMEERIESQYQSEDQQLRLFVFFAGLTLLLSLIGLIGLVVNSVTHRTREISIRRVVGASVGDIIKLFTWDYLKPVVLANIPAWFLAWYFLGQWIERYSQRIEMGPSLYLIGGGTILAVTMIVVTLLVTRSALTPPVHALRYE
jgi:putative ABC transport system permease protein